jgi:hypothetical protein
MIDETTPLVGGPKCSSYDTESMGDKGGERKSNVDPVFFSIALLGTTARH